MMYAGAIFASMRSARASRNSMARRATSSPCANQSHSTRVSSCHHTGSKPFDANDTNRTSSGNLTPCRANEMSAPAAR